MNARLFRSLAAGSLAAGMLFAIAAPHAGASNLADTGDGIVPASTTITATSTNFKASGIIDGILIHVTCTSSSFTGKTPAPGGGLVVKIAPPAFSGCTDDGGGTDTVVTNQTNGKWKVTFKDKLNDDAGEVTGANSGDKLKLTVPKAGATFTSSLLPQCTVIIAPNGPASVNSKYDDINTATLTNGVLPVGNNGGCTTGPNSTLNATYTLSPGIHDS